MLRTYIIKTPRVKGFLEHEFHETCHSITFHFMKKKKTQFVISVGSKVILSLFSMSIKLIYLSEILIYLCQVPQSNTHILIHGLVKVGVTGRDYIYQILMIHPWLHTPLGPGHVGWPPLGFFVWITPSKFSSGPTHCRSHNLDSDLSGFL